MSRFIEDWCTQSEKPSMGVLVRMATTTWWRFYHIILCRILILSLLLTVCYVYDVVEIVQFYQLNAKSIHVSSLIACFVGFGAGVVLAPRIPPWLRVWTAQLLFYSAAALLRPFNDRIEIFACSVPTLKILTHAWGPWTLSTLVVMLWHHWVIAVCMDVVKSIGEQRQGPGNSWRDVRVSWRCPSWGKWQ